MLKDFACVVLPGVAVSSVCEDVQAQGGDGGAGAASAAIQTPQARELKSLYNLIVKVNC